MEQKINQKINQVIRQLWSEVQNGVIVGAVKESDCNGIWRLERKECGDMIIGRFRIFGEKIIATAMKNDPYILWNNVNCPKRQAQ